ncbi:adhesion G protein-coupled receptor E3-like [Megalops cyprinoides]|uniref:adhesion G protein-coupled receptor E3-like n=1 Tax=Megalops cyprinoides TaxID=118141 RepID=UPI0018654DD9|nr:adhesion G protein-coupled receptor E3-like [Megalops cyprinoides]
MEVGQREKENGKSEEQCQLDSLDNLLDNSSSLWKGEVGEKQIDVALKIPEKLALALVKPTQTQSSCNLSTEKLEVQTFAIGPEANLTETPQLKARDNVLKIDLPGIAKNNNGSGAVVFIAYVNMEDVLKAEFFHKERKTSKTMMSSVISASLPNTKNTALPEPVNFTLRHLTQVDPESNLTCVYWNHNGWIVDGCEARETNATHTVCTCNHLSTFALIMQTDRPPEDDIILKWISMIALSVGLLILALAILTFILCRWNPKVSNTARLNLSICLFLAHLLFLLVQSFLFHIQKHKLVCAVISGVLHFLFLSSFVWMFLEALQLFLLVRNLTEVRIIQREGIHCGFLLLIGYGIPCLVVGVSAGVVPDGYGSDQCWLKTDEGLIWSFLGPVCFLLAVNVILFITIMGYLWFTVARRNKEISQLKDTRMMVVKAILQFIILGCPWIFGFFVNSSKVLEYLFLLITSQQGTFIFLVHCVFRKEVQEQYRQWWKNICGSKDPSESSHSFTTFTTSQTATIHQADGDYEEIKDSNQQPHADAAVTSIHYTASSPRDPSDSLNYATVNFPKRPASEDQSAITLTKDSTEYSTVSFHTDPPNSDIYSTVSLPKQHPETITDDSATSVTVNLHMDPPESTTYSNLRLS